MLIRYMCMINYKRIIINYMCIINFSCKRLNTLNTCILCPSHKHVHFNATRCAYVSR